MKKLIYICMVLVVGCSSEDAIDCFQTAGTLKTIEVNTASFTKILVNRDIELYLRQGSETKVEIESGENLLNDIKAVVINDELQLTNNNTCNYVRDYGITKIFVTAPNIVEIRSSSQFDVNSVDTLNFPSLKLISENFNVDAFAIGDFRLNVNLNQLTIASNKLSTFYISGTVENLNVGFYAGDGRFEGGNLIAQNIALFHRGSNDMIVNPQQTITGEIRSTGNVIALNRPPVVNVESFYTGSLIFD